jgi:hypothetical protein
VSQPPTGPRPTLTTRRTWLWDVLACLLIVVASIAVVLVHVPKHTSVSPIDEYVYIDYYAKVLDKGVVLRGEETGAYAREYLACHGVRAIGVYPEALCRTDGIGRDTAYPNAGVTSADLYTPLYFAVTRVLAQPLVWLGVELTDAGRYVGAIWLALGVILLYLTVRRAAGSRLLAGGVSLLAIGSLPAYWSNTYISTDATAILAGSLMLFVAVPLLTEATRYRIIMLSGAAAVVTALKLQNLLAVGVVAVWLLGVALVDAWRTSTTARGRLAAWIRDRRSIAALAAVAIGLIVQVLWVVIRAAVAVGPQPDQGVGVPFSRKATFLESFKFLPGIANGALTPEAVGEFGIPVATILTVVIAAGVFGLAVRARSGSTDEVLGITVLGIAIVAAPLLAVANVIVGGFYFVLPARYGSALLPAMLLCAALLCHVGKRWVPPIILFAGALSFVLSLSFTEG